MFQEARTDLATLRMHSGPQESDYLDITVFTSQRCLFCKPALQAANEAARRLNKTGLSVRVVESPIEEDLRNFEKYRTIAVPLTIVGTDQIVGVPAAEDIERMVYSTIHSRSKRT